MNDLDIKKLLFRLLRNWYWFIICIGIAGASAWLYIRYTIPQYEVRCSVVLQEKEVDQNVVNNLLPRTGVSGGMFSGGTLAKQQALQNEIRLMRSPSIMARVLEQLELTTSFYWKGRFLNTELYKNSPISIDSLNLNRLAYSQLFELEVLSDSTFSFSDADTTNLHQFGTLIENKYGSFRVNRKFDQLPRNLVLVQFHNLESLSYIYSSRLIISPEGFTNNVLAIKMITPMPEKAAAVMELLIEEYNKEYISAKNQRDRNTLQFLNARVKEVSQELNGIEDDALNFKIDNEITSISSLQVESILIKIEEQNKEIAQLELRKGILDALRDYLIQERPDSQYNFLPTTLQFQQTQEAELLDKYNELLMERERLRFSAKLDNPAVVTLDQELMRLRERVLKVIKQELEELNKIISNYTADKTVLEKNITTLPRKERDLLDIARQKEILENLYIFLLQRKEEVSMALAVTPGNSRILEQPRSRGPVLPVSLMIYLIALVGGLLVPILIATIREILDTSVGSKEDLEKFTNIPILGFVGFSRSDKKIVVHNRSRSAVSEMFRLLRTNIQYILKGKTNQVVLVTSSMSGEGKSFITANIGMTLALAGKKTVLLGMDLRKPKLGQYIKGTPPPKGISNYIVGEASVDELIEIYEGHPDMHFIGSGPIPPNPAELIMTEKMDELIDELKQRYDYILLDTPPIGLVTDALLLNKFADACILVVRQNVTSKGQLRFLEDVYQDQKLNQPSIIFNGVKSAGLYGSYNYGYGYGYGYGYYEEPDSKGFFARLFKRK